MPHMTGSSTTSFLEMTAVDRAARLEEIWSEYEQALLESGESPESARANIERNRRDLLGDDGNLREGHHFFALREGNDLVGQLWISLTPPGAREAYIYDVVVLEQFRGRGWGREIMRRAESWARAAGAAHIGLNVFGNNTTARRLYQSLGYAETAIRMRKSLDS